ncbi:hypothetical protein [Qaidamihabitans albus]|uniref:hypothetical protein n=1 Tax=Qaidamihabitans albus TaxID=2795733 RepID=UPI0018F2579B|nr:hypothetical protein [Qaidamihabitans albus]
MRRTARQAVGATPRRRAWLPCVAALMLVAHLLGPHADGGAAYLRHADPSPAGHASSEPHQPHEPPQHHDSAGDGSCGYLCSRDGGQGTAGAVAGWPHPVAVPAPPFPSGAGARAAGARAPPDLVRELRVMRV